MYDRVIAGVLGGSVVLEFSSLSPGATDEVVAQRLVIVDGEQRPRIVAEASAYPRLVFRSEAGEELVRLGIGDEPDTFPFGQEGVPHLTLQAGGTLLRLWVSPPAREGESEYQKPGASLTMSSATEDSGHFLNAVIQPEKAVVGIATFDPEDPAASVMDPGVRLSIDAQGKVTTRLGRESK